VTGGEAKGAPLYYGCSLGTGHIRRLNRGGDFGTNRVTASTIRLAGPFVGYVEPDIEALGVVPVAIVVDVRHGTLVRSPRGSDLEDGRLGIVGLVVTARGTEAWIARLRALRDPAGGVRRAGDDRVSGDDLRRQGPVRRARRRPFGRDRRALACPGIQQPRHLLDAGGRGPNSAIG